MQFNEEATVILSGEIWFVENVHHIYVLWSVAFFFLVFLGYRLKVVLSNDTFYYEVLKEIIQ